MAAQSHALSLLITMRMGQESAPAVRLTHRHFVEHLRGKLPNRLVHGPRARHAMCGRGPRPARRLLQRGLCRSATNGAGDSVRRRQTSEPGGRPHRFVPAVVDSAAGPRGGGGGSLVGGSFSAWFVEPKWAGPYFYAHLGLSAAHLVRPDELHV